MGKKLAQLIGSGIGFTSEAIHAARNRSSNPDPASPSSIPRSLPADDSSGEYAPAGGGPAELPAYEGRAELPAYSEVEYEVGGDGDQLERGVDQDEAVWELDETAQRMKLPKYEESVPLVLGAVDQPEDVKEEQEQVMVRSLVEMAGPVQPMQRIPCPVIIPQRRPGQKERGFVRAYAPVLGDCGISQDVFVRFIEDFFQASKASPWIDVVYVAAEIIGFFPETAAQITSAIIQTIAGAAREIQSRHRANTFLDRVNRDLFIPRGLYAMVMAFREEVPGQQHGALSLLSQKLGKTLFATEKLDINQPISNPTFDPAPTIAKYTNPDEHPEMNVVKKQLKTIRLASGKTHGQLELPEAAPLVYPDLDLVATRAMEGKGMESEGTREKLKNAGVWVQDYMDRKAQATYESKNLGSSLAVPETGRKGFVSRYNDPNHPVNNGKLTSVLTGGLMGNKPGLIERATTSIRESQDAKRIARGETPSEPLKEKWQRYQSKKKPGLIKKVLQQDVLYLLVVNMPSEEELKQSVDQLERLMRLGGSRGPH
ncbi:hypothetical protein FE257_004593 [Aspergillus nanangensis]|uniref:Uncharacterized protein n=1 Tax=Aspergillus nanangensis TaxID=2582783 RepID=A0AAD4CYE9_ASPNN|nr:hypothetical protein FE257_004593 [Aspergillus nanangensis]